jgi:hypothetical protein
MPKEIKTIKRTVRSCNECGYELIERVNKLAIHSIVTKCDCVQCGSPSLHIMYVDERNIDRSED